MDDMLSVVIIGLCVFSFLAVLAGIGSFYGGDWELVAQGVTSFILIITCFCIGSFTLVKLMGKR